PHFGGGERDEKQRDVGDGQPTCPGRRGWVPLESRSDGAAARHRAYSIDARSLDSAVSDAVTRQCFFALSSTERAVGSSASGPIVSTASITNFVNFNPSRVLSSSPTQLTFNDDQSSLRVRANARNVRIRQLATAPVSIVSGDQ